MPNYTTTPGNARQLINDIYSGLIAPQGGLYQPGAPVMLPPVNIPPVPQPPQQFAQSSPYDAAYQPGIPTSSAYTGGWGSPAFGGGNNSDIRVATVNPDGTPSASGSMIAGKDQSQLGASPQGMAFAYGQGIPRAPAPPAPPALSAIAQALGLGMTGPAAGGFLSGDPGQTDWSVANQGGQGINGPVSAPSSLPPNPPPTNIRVPVGVPPSAPRIPTPAFHAALMALQQLTTPASQAAVAAGQGGYVVKGSNKRRNGNALGENALMPTRAMDGSLRNTYAD